MQTVLVSKFFSENEKKCPISSNSRNGSQNFCAKGDSSHRFLNDWIWIGNKEVIRLFICYSSYGDKKSIYSLKGVVTHFGVRVFPRNFIAVFSTSEYLVPVLCQIFNERNFHFCENYPIVKLQLNNFPTCNLDNFEKMDTAPKRKEISTSGLKHWIAS